MDCSTPASLFITNSQSLLKLMSTQLVMSSNYLILCPLLLLLLSIFLSMRVFSNESVLHIRWPKYWSFNFNINPSNKYLRIEWLDLLAVQGTLKGLLQYLQFKSINSSALNFLYGSTFTSIHGYWKNHSFDYTDIYQSSNVSNFLTCCLSWS